jgi:hypothetical protein
MTVFTYKATQRRADSNNAVGKGMACTPICLVATQEVAAAASSSTVSFGYIPSNARLLAASKVYNDDLATSGSPTLDIGLFAVNSNVTSDDDALTDGIALSSASTAGVGAHVVKDFANAGKPAYLFVSGQTTDPGGLLEVKGTIRDAATNAAGTVTLELYYTVD